MKKLLLIVGSAALITGLAQGYMLFKGDGSDEPGFVSPHLGPPPPPPAAHIASAETFIPYPGPRGPKRRIRRIRRCCSAS